MGNFNEEMKTVKKKKKQVEKQEIKTLSDIKNAFHVLISRPDIAEKSQ